MKLSLCKARYSRSRVLSCPRGALLFSDNNPIAARINGELYVDRKSFDYATNARTRHLNNFTGLTTRLTIAGVKRMEVYFCKLEDHIADLFKWESPKND